MFLKLKKKIAKRKYFRFALKAERLKAELRNWGCSEYTCLTCYSYQKYHSCYLCGEIQKWTVKFSKFIEKYGEFVDEAEGYYTYFDTTENLPEIGVELLNGKTEAKET